MWMPKHGLLKLGHKLYLKRNYDRALEQLQKALELDSNFVSTHMMLAHVYAGKGMYEKSLATCEKVTALYGSSPFSRALPSLDFVEPARSGLRR